MRHLPEYMDIAHRVGFDWATVQPRLVLSQPVESADVESADHVGPAHAADARSAGVCGSVAAPPPTGLDIALATYWVAG